MTIQENYQLKVCKHSEILGNKNMLEGYEVGISNNPLVLPPRNIQVGGYYCFLYDGKCCIDIPDCDVKNEDYKVCFVRQLGSGMVCAVVGNKPIL